MGAVLAVEEGVVPYAEFAYQPAGPERPAIGPDRIAAGADGLAALWDPVDARVIVLTDLRVTGGFHTLAVDDLAFAGRDLVLLQGRNVLLTDVGGKPLGHLPVPAIVPTHVDLLVQDGAVWGVDPFGNRHGIARVADSTLVAWAGDSYGGKAFVTASARKTDGVHKASTRAFDGGWSIVDLVVRDFPIGVQRTVRHDDRAVPLETSGRAWVPTDDADVDADGRLVVMVPLDDGLHVRRITP